MQDKLDQFAVCAQEICRHFVNDTKKPLTEFLFNLDGICMSISNENAEVTNQAVTCRNSNKLFKNIHVSIEKYESYVQFKKMLNDAKANFELAQTRTLEATVESDIYFSIMSLMNECIRLGENEDIISSFLYRLPMPKYDSTSIHEMSGSTERFTSSTRTHESVSLGGSQSSLMLAKPTISSSNYLLSFFEYCKTLFEYFREKSNSSRDQHSSCFAILNYSPASLICKLLFEDGIKPVLIESLTQKLNLNLTAIILHNSCPRLKLTSSGSSRSNLLGQQISHTSSSQSISYMKQTSNTSYPERKLTVLNANPWSPTDAQIYNLNAFYLVLNQSDIIYCSRKKPDEFVRDLLLKVFF